MSESPVFHSGSDMVFISNNDIKDAAMLQFYLVFVGITLFVNGVRIYNSYSTDASKHVGVKDAAVVNLFTGFMGVVLLTVMVVRSTTTGESLAPAAYSGLFVLTYIWLAINAFTGADGKAFGWFCLLVPFIGIPVAILTFLSAVTGFDYWMVFSWLAWSVLWFMFFLLLVCQLPIGRLTGVVTAAQGITTALMPALLYFWGII